MKKLALVLAVAMASGRSYALGLGDIELHSVLNEPLNAEVPLLLDNPDELNNAEARLGSAEDFVRAGIERSDALSDLSFSIVSGKDGKSVVKITSTKPVREPFLDFVVQLRWQSGQLLREYTLLLDPPVFGRENAAPVAASVPASAPAPAPAPAAPLEPPAPAPAVSAPQSAPAPQEAPPAMGATTAVAAVKPAMLDKNSYGPTRRADTLWSLANSLKPDDTVSVYQMMMALLQANPEAFYSNNVNGLKAGYVLRVPDKAAVVAIDQEKAWREAARQYEQWQKSRRGIVSPAEGGNVTAAPAEQGQSAPTAAGAEDREKEMARLRLVAPAESSDKSAAVGGKQAELDKLRNDLAIALESSDTSKRESDELRSRVAALEGQIKSMEHLLSLKDQALSDMQKRSGLAVPSPAQASVSAAPAQLPAPAPVQAAPSTTAKSIPAKPAASAKPAPKPAAASPDLLANPSLVGAMAGAALLLASVAWLIVRRRRGSDNDNGDLHFQPAIKEETPATDSTVRPVTEEQAAVPGLEDVDDTRLNRVAEEVAQHAEQDIPQTASELDMSHTSEGDIDPIVEADVYLAYRRYPQAEALVQNALAKEAAGGTKGKQSRRHDLQAKLLEIYYAAKKSDEFQTAAQNLYEDLGGNAEDPVWQRILPMGLDLCPDSALFAAGQRPVSAEAAQSGGSSQDFFDLSIGSGQAIASSQDEKTDFDLNLNEEPAALAEPHHGSPESADSKHIPDKQGDHGAFATNGHEQEKAQNPWEIESGLTDFGNIDFGLNDSDLMAGTDVVGTKLDLARAYIDMGDIESARDILQEVVEEGNEKQKQEAKGLLEKFA